MGTKIGNNTFKLIKKMPSFTGGYSELLNFSSVSRRYNTSASEDEADSKALHSDWAAVGEDISSALRTFELKHAK